MNWIEVNVQVIHEAVEAVSDILVSVGAHGVAIEDPQLINDMRNSGIWDYCGIPEYENTEIVTISAYYADDEKLQGRLAQIEDELNIVEGRIGKFRFGNTRFRTVSEVDWANEWKQYFHVTHVGESLVIKPSWEAYEAKAGEKVIEIDPGMAFGTGTHHTTNMCMARLEKIITPEATVFDVGTGSGILAIAAALLGAKEVKAVDIDAVAVKVAKENIADNGLADKIDVKEGDLLHGTEGKADVIIANIIADIIIMLLKDVPGKLKDDGVLLASGIIDDRVEDVKATAEANGMQVDFIDQKDCWIAMQMSKVK